MMGVYMVEGTTGWTTSYGVGKGERDSPPTPCGVGIPSRSVRNRNSLSMGQSCCNKLQKISAPIGPFSLSKDYSSGIVVPVEVNDDRKDVRYMQGY